jgi:nucleoside-diphosphate kinase
MSKPERTLILFKPDTLARGLCGEVLSRFERAGLRIITLRKTRFTRALLARHYAELKQKNPAAYHRNAPYLAGKDVIALVLEGPNAISKARSLAGPTDPLAAAPGTIRGDFSSDSIPFADSEDRGLNNLVHASDSAASARREIRLWFNAS